MGQNSTSDMLAQAVAGDQAAIRHLRADETFMQPIRAVWPEADDNQVRCAAGMALSWARTFDRLRAAVRSGGAR